tara:strand:- start:258 stop:557 length:300 start_codon:yes stop_codon:yes gene_type:complete
MLLDVQLYLLSLFVQVDQKKSLQRGVSIKDGNTTPGYSDFSYEELYHHLVLLYEKARFKTGLAFPEKVFLAKYYVSYKNECNGRTLRYSESYTPDNQGY